MKAIIFVVGQTLGWFACVIGAAQHRHWLGVLVVTGLLVLHLVMRSGRSVGRILSVVVFSILFGFCFDSLLITAGVYESSRWLVPAPFATVWLLALWVNFSLIVDIPLIWLQQHLGIAGVFGAVFGPAAYLGGQRFGAIRILEPALFQLVVLAMGWALGLAVFMFVVRKLSSLRVCRSDDTTS